MKVPFFRLKLTAAEKKAAAEVIRSNWLTTGPKVKEFEQKISQYCGARYAAATASGTAGLHLSLKAVGVSSGDEVITTPMTMAATAEAILYCGAKPILADIEPDSLNVSPDRIERRISKKTKAIVTVDMAGLPCEYQKIKSLARRYKVKVIADAAHSFGGEYHGKKAGTLADSTVFSFYPTKNLTTGEGGMVLSSNKRFHDKIKRLSLHAMNSSGWKRYRGGSWRYDIDDLGYKYNMAEIPAAIGLAQLERFDRMMDKRKRLARRYRENLAGLREFIESPSEPSDRGHAYHLFIIKMNLKRWRIGRDRMIEELSKRGVGCGVHFIPLYRFSYYKKIFDQKAKELPETERAFKRIISFPFYPDLNNAEADYVCEVLKDLSIKFRK